MSGATKGAMRTVCLDIRSEIVSRSKHHIAELETYQRFWYYLALFKLRMICKRWRVNIF